MTFRSRLGVVVVAAGLCTLAGPIAGVQQRPTAGRPLPDVDIRAGRAPAAPQPDAAREVAQAGRAARLHPHSGGLRLLDAPGLSIRPDAGERQMRGLLAATAARLGLDPADVSALTLLRDYVGASNGVRHLVFAQSFDGIPVFDGVLAVHLESSGRVARIASSAARGERRARAVAIAAGDALSIAAANVGHDHSAAARVGGAGGATGHAVFARGPFLRDVAVGLTWLPLDGGVRLAWRVALEPPGEPQLYDVLVDAETGDVLLRRNRVLYAEGTGRVLQSAAMQAVDPRRPDETPSGSGGCPPPTNHEVRSLTAPFRDRASVLFDTGLLEGNNARVFLGNDSTNPDPGTFDGSEWSFDFPFNTSGAAAASLFFAMNFVHDFFYDLGFTEAAGNFQQSNFGRGGLGGDRIHAIARAAGRNNATFQTAPDGESPIISMFMWDGAGCWAQDVDADGSLDLDGDYDLDIVIHEFHHGVSHRLNTAFTGSEADAIGEGGSDFFAYSINGDTTLAEYAYPGGLRSVNAKGYGDWVCFLGLFCEPHANGEIFANVLWDLRERFRVDGVRGSEGAAVNESHQLYVDALALSPPSPTMLDLRDALLLADDLRNPGSPRSVNFCRIWESFAGRGMGVQARDTADTGSMTVQADASVPSGCEPPPAPPVVTLAVAEPTATEAGPTSGRFVVSRGESQSVGLAVSLAFGGTARNGTDYVGVPGSVMIPAGAVSAVIEITPIDDTLLESNETAYVTLRTGSGYTIGSPSSGTVTIVSDDVAPDFVVTALTAPQTAAAGATISVTDTTRNQGTGASAPSVTAFYLSADFSLSASDPQVGSRAVPSLAIGASHTATSSVTLPSPLAAGTYRLIAKADGPGAHTETNEYNNLRTASIGVGPDLVVTSLSAPSSAGAGTTILVSDVTANSGADAAGPSQTRFYLSVNAALDESDTPLQARTVGPLAAGATSGGSTSVTIPPGTATGAYYLFAKADASNGVAEAAETNNTKPVIVRVGPDLQVSVLSVPARAASGGTIAVSDTVRNGGAGAAASSTTAFYLSADYRIDAGDVRLAATRAVPALAAGASSAGTTSLTLPAVAGGMWYLVARADDTGAVSETLESNNARYTTVAIGPDLDITVFSAPSSTVAGAVLSVTDTVKNIGVEAAGASVTRYYLSVNHLVDASDILVGERSVGPLAPNASSTGTGSVALPADLSGRFYLLAAADGAGTLQEAYENNNTGLRLITIGP